MTETAGTADRGDSGGDTETGNAELLHVVADGVATLTINRPERHNALSWGVISGLRISAMVFGVSVSTIVFDAVAGDDPANQAEYASGVRAAMLVATGVSLVGIVVALMSGRVVTDDGEELTSLVSSHPLVPSARHRLRWPFRAGPTPTAGAHP